MPCRRVDHRPSIDPYVDLPDTVALPLRFRTIRDAPAADTVFAAVYANAMPVVWLDSNAIEDPQSRFSFMADVADPLSYVVRYRSQARELEIVGRAGRSVVRQSVLDFLKRSTLIGASPESLAALGPAVETLAKAEKSHAGRFQKALDSL